MHPLSILDCASLDDIARSQMSSLYQPSESSHLHLKLRKHAWTRRLCDNQYQHQVAPCSSAATPNTSCSLVFVSFLARLHQHVRDASFQQKEHLGYTHTHAINLLSFTFNITMSWCARTMIITPQKSHHFLYENSPGNQQKFNWKSITFIIKHT